MAFPRQLVFLLVAGVMGHAAHAYDLPWTVLLPKNDTRDPEMRAWDAADSRFLVNLINESEPCVHHSIVWNETPLEKLLTLETPFAELRIDPVHPMDLTPEEKAILKEWILRGGFLLIYEDNYPYEQEDFRRAASLPVYDYLIHDLPAQDSRFTVEKASDAHPIFHRLHDTVTVPAIQHEKEVNPHYRGRTVLRFNGRITAFFMGRYSYFSEGRWVPMERPFPATFSSDPRSYFLVLNLYIYACL
ncbi:MAG: hypothetical protein QM796_22080 [Chthoniobacteraceae bacterium]